jgi:hypothetical protein
MSANRYRDEMMLALARELVGTHGVFFAAALLAEYGVPLHLALWALTSTKQIS